MTCELYLTAILRALHELLALGSEIFVYVIMVIEFCAQCEKRTSACTLWPLVPQGIHSNMFMSSQNANIQAKVSLVG